MHDALALSLETVAPVPDITTFHSRIGELIVSGRLPAGLQIEAKLTTDGLFGSLAVEVRTCPVVVVDGLAVLASNVFRLSKSGIAIQRQLVAAAAEVHAPPAKVSFALTLLQAQRRYIQSLPADADLTPRWRPAWMIPATSSAWC